MTLSNFGRRFFLLLALPVVLWLGCLPARASTHSTPKSRATTHAGHKSASASASRHTTRAARSTPHSSRTKVTATRSRAGAAKAAGKTVVATRMVRRHGRMVRIAVAEPVRSPLRERAVERAERIPAFDPASLTLGDITTGEDPVVRAAAIQALGGTNGTAMAIDPATAASSPSSTRSSPSRVAPSPAPPSSSPSRSPLCRKASSPAILPSRLAPATGST